ncbi:MAG: dosC 2, partial [Firmicutes bacterium]|nr:dosC 2 [Bacillota bacterium]
FYFRNHKTNLMMKVIQYTAMFTTLLAGAIITCIDQLVTNSISPFIIVCSITGAIYLIRPVYAGMISILTYLIFYYALSLTQFDPGLLLSNRVNGLFAIGVGFCLSIILWRTNIINLKQKYFIARQQKELEEKNKQLEQLAFFDPLSGVFNRRYFEKQLRQEIARMNRYGNKSCVAILDVDDFKIINDRFGHPAGDYLLQKTAEIISNQIRESDILARWGGDEFILLLPNTSLDAGKRVAEKIRNNIEANLFVIDGHEIHTTVSFGVTSIPAYIDDSFELSYINADKALYYAKQSGKNKVTTL